ncbi:recombinase family protein [Bradyrhizobium sp. JR4.1]|uniref:recombinase family protein n=1 Tax=Bradyrhizobium sp. JR4.1 TaxID=3156372 RepID=UPI003390CC8E
MHTRSSESAGDDRGKRAGFKSLRDSWADTTTAHGRVMLTVLGGLAEFERELIRTRTGEGRERAKRGGNPWSEAEADGPSAKRGNRSPRRERS